MCECTHSEAWSNCSCQQDWLSPCYAGAGPPITAPLTMSCTPSVLVR